MTSVFPLGSCCCSSKASQSLSRTSWPCWLGFCWPTATSLPPSWAASSMRTWWKKVHGSWANVQFRLITIVKITTGVEWTFDFCHFQSTHLLLTWEKRGCIFTLINPLSPHPPFLHNVEFNSFFCYGRNIWSVVFFLFFFYLFVFLCVDPEKSCVNVSCGVCLFICVLFGPGFDPGRSVCSSWLILSSICSGVSASFAVKLFKSWLSEKDIGSVATSLRKVGMDNRLMVRPKPAAGILQGVNGGILFQLKG